MEKTFSKPCEATLDSRDPEVLFFLLKHTLVLKVLSCTGFIKEEIKKDVVSYP